MKNIYGVTFATLARMVVVLGVASAVARIVSAFDAISPASCTNSGG